MKIAILHTGHSRSFKRCINNWKLGVKDRYDADFYFGIWDESGLKLDPTPDNARQFPGHFIVDNSFDAEVDRTIISKKDVVEAVCPILTTEDKVLYLKHEEHHPKITLALQETEMKCGGGGHGNYARWMGISTTMWHQWYMVRETYRLLEASYKSYDLIIRTRPDMAWVGYPQFTEYTKVQNPIYSGNLPHDYLVYGPPDQMDLVCRLYDMLPYINANRHSIEGAGMDSHTTLLWLFTHTVQAEDNQMNVMSMIRKHSYPTHEDVSFLLDEQYAEKWKNPEIDRQKEYGGL